MTSVRLPPPSILGAITAPHAVDIGQSFRVHVLRALERLEIPHLVKDDDVAIPAPAVLCQSNLACADAFYAGNPGDGEFRRTFVNNLLNKIHDYASPGQTFDRSMPYLRFSSGLCHDSVTSIQLSRLFLLTPQPITTCSADLPSADRRRRLPLPDNRNDFAAVTHSGSAYGELTRSKADRRRQPCGVRGHWSPNQQSAAVTHSIRPCARRGNLAPADRRRRQELRQAPTAWARLTASRTRVAAAVTHLLGMGPPLCRMTAGGWRHGNWRPPAFSSFHQGRSNPSLVSATQNTEMGRWIRENFTCVSW